MGCFAAEQVIAEANVPADDLSHAFKEMKKAGSAVELTVSDNSCRTCFTNVVDQV